MKRKDQIIEWIDGSLCVCVCGLMMMLIIMQRLMRSVLVIRMMNRSLCVCVRAH